MLNARRCGGLIAISRCCDSLASRDRPLIGGNSAAYPVEFIILMNQGVDAAEYR
jgi:hypothetical protein